MAGEKLKEIVKYHKSEKCFKCGIMVQKNTEGYFRCQCGFEWANLFIKRIPVDAYLMFKGFAEQEYCADYGMAIKGLLNDTVKMTNLMQMISELNERISSLESKPKKKEIRTLSGKTIKGGRDNG